MKVGVCSVNQDGAQGRSSIIMITSSVYSITQNNRVAILSTGDISNFRKSIQISDNTSPSRSTSVYKSMLTSGQLKPEEVMDFGSKIGKEEVYLFDIFSTSLDVTDVNDIFISTLSLLRRELVFVELQGNLDDEFNQAVIDECDAILFIFTPDHKSIESIKTLSETLPKKILRKSGFMCNKYDRDVISEKHLAKLIGIDVKNVLIMPDNKQVKKLSLSGELNKIGMSIVLGEGEVLDMRIRVKEFMSYLFDTKAHKIIKGVEQWHKL